MRRLKRIPSALWGHLRAMARYWASDYSKGYRWGVFAAWASTCTLWAVTVVIFGFGEESAVASGFLLGSTCAAIWGYFWGLHGERQNMRIRYGEHWQTDVFRGKLAREHQEAFEDRRN